MSREKDRKKNCSIIIDRGMLKFQRRTLSQFKY